MPTIIKRAKEHDFYLSKPKRKAHDREVLTNYVGELVQHDSSEHKWAPDAGVKWHLITSLDDHSRLLLYADFVERETSWDHISALEDVVLHYGVPYAYYTDCHSIFRFVQGRDSIWRKHYLVTDDIDPQWKTVLGNAGSILAMRSLLRPKGRSSAPMAGSRTESSGPAPGKASRRSARPEMSSKPKNTATTTVRSIPRPARSRS